MLNERMSMEEELRAKLKDAVKNANNSAEMDRQLAKAQAEASKAGANAKAAFEGPVSYTHQTLPTT